MIVLDIETVPCEPEKVIPYRRYFKQFEELEKKAGKLSTFSNDLPVEQFEDLLEIDADLTKSASLDPFSAKIVAIGVITKIEKERVRQCFFDTDEKRLLEAFWTFISENRIPCKTVTYNGLGFDLPMLYFRSMINEVPVCWPDFSLKKYSSWPHFDVMMQLSFFGTLKWKGLTYMAHIFGYECNISEADESGMVFGWYQSGNYYRIQEHNLSDCDKTAFLFRKIMDYYNIPRK